MTSPTLSSTIPSPSDSNPHSPSSNASPTRKEFQIDKRTAENLFHEMSQTLTQLEQGSKKGREGEEDEVEFEEDSSLSRHHFTKGKKIGPMGYRIKKSSTSNSTGFRSSMRLNGSNKLEELANAAQVSHLW